MDRVVADAVGDLGFATALLVAVDLADPRRSSMVNAGHPPPFLLRGRAAPRRLSPEVALPLGLSWPNHLVAQPLPLAPGDRLALFSDGVVEARSESGEPFGEDRLRGRLEELRDLSPREAARRTIASVREHRGAELTDDATLMLIDLPGP